MQCKLALKPDGLFLAAILGGETLKFVHVFLLNIEIPCSLLLSFFFVCCKINPFLFYQGTENSMHFGSHGA